MTRRRGDAEDAEETQNRIRQNTESRWCLAAYPGFLSELKAPFPSKFYIPSSAKESLRAMVVGMTMLNRIISANAL